MNVENIDNDERYNINTPTPANKQKLLNASKDVVAPSQKAITFVNEVIVIEGPACLSPSTNLSSAERLVSV
jgi:hypothetical protein